MTKNFLIVIAFFLASLTAAGQASGEAQMREKIAQAAQAVKSLQCDFVQTKQLRLLNDKMVSRGKMHYANGGKLRWEYTSPYTYLLIMNGDRVLLKNKDRQDVIDMQQNKLFREIGNIMMNSVVGKCLSDDRNFRTQLTTEGGEWVATLTPLRKEMKQMFQTITLHFDQRQGVVNRVVLKEKGGDETVIELTNIRKNETVPASVFAVE